ncbi:MAG: hypothetical protein HRU19_17420 [Pseudobacteriovorax sp.]|nr:hypothetical protein [Pseudobacteriovorax sp.]
MKLVATVVLVVGFFLTETSFALIEGQLLVGQRSSKPDLGDTFTGTETKLSVYVDPIPLVPVGVGLTFANTSYDEDGLDSGTEISLDVTAWIPIPGSIEPYAKIGYIVSGELKGGGDSVDIGGTKFGLGVKFSLIPLVAVMAEVEKSSTEITSGVADGFKYDNTSFFVGVAAGI